MGVESSNNIPEGLDANKDGNLDVKDMNKILRSIEYGGIDETKKLGEYLSNTEIDESVKNVMIGGLKKMCFDAVSIYSMKSSLLTKNIASNYMMPDQIGALQLYGKLTGMENGKISLDGKRGPQTDRIMKSIFEEKKAAEEQRIADKKAAEEQRIADKKAAEEQRIADKKAAEEQRIADKKAAEAQKIADEKAEQEKKDAEKATFIANINETAKPENLEYMTNTINQAVDDIPDVEGFDWSVKGKYKEKLINAVKGAIIDGGLNQNQMKNLVNDIPKQLQVAYDKSGPETSNINEWVGHIDEKMDDMVTHREVNNIISKINNNNNNNNKVGELNLTFQEITDIKNKLNYSPN